MFDEFLGRLRSAAMEFPEGSVWLNVTKPISMHSLRGHVVILDFWTYCCINCIHMASVLAKLEQRYRGKPVVVIGVHSAKFENEEDPRNIREAIGRYEIRHPVVVDRKMHLWKSYGVGAWPTLIMIDAQGRIAGRLPGEVSLGCLENKVSGLLEKGRRKRVLASRRIRIMPSAAVEGSVLRYPGKIALSPDRKSIAICDSGHDRILVVSEDGVVERRIGGVRGFRDGSFANAAFYRPQGVSWPSTDTIYVADTENHALRRIGLWEERVETLAGTGVQGGYPKTRSEVDGKGASLNSPWDLVCVKDDIYIAMAGLHQIWKYSIGRGTIFPYAGSGREDIEDGTLENSMFAQPSGLAFSREHIYVADSEASGIRSISLKTGFVSTVMGSGLFAFGSRDGPVQEARLQHPLGVAASGNVIYVADTYNSAIRAIDLGSESVRTLVSMKAKSECRIDDPECDTLGLYEPSDVKINGNVLYIADTNNHLVRKYELVSKTLTTLKIR